MSGQQAFYDFMGNIFVQIIGVGLFIFIFFYIRGQIKLPDLKLRSGTPKVRTISIRKGQYTEIDEEDNKTTKYIDV